MNVRSLQISFAATLLAICALNGMSGHAQQTADSIPAQAMLQPAELVQMLSSAAKPLVLQTGSLAAAKEVMQTYVGSGRSSPNRPAVQG